MLPSCYDSSFHRSRYGFGRQHDCHEQFEVYDALGIHDLKAIHDLGKCIESTLKQRNSALEQRHSNLEQRHSTLEQRHSNLEQRHCLAIGCNAVALFLDQYRDEPMDNHVDIWRSTNHGWFNLC